MDRGTRILYDFIFAVFNNFLIRFLNYIKFALPYLHFFNILSNSK
jgi:hypothetical protein